MASARQKKPSVFVGSSKESLSIAYAVQANLDEDAEVTVWPQGVFRLSKSATQNLLETVPRVDFAIFIFARDDMVKIRRQKLNAVRDNVIFELGMFIAALGLNRTFIVMPAKSDGLRLPTDIIGLGLATFNGERFDKNLRAALGPACDTIRGALQELGPRTRRVARRSRPKSAPVGLFQRQECEPTQVEEFDLKCSKVVHFVHISKEFQRVPFQTKCQTIRYWHDVVNLDGRGKPHSVAYLAATSGRFLTEKGNVFFGTSASVGLDELATHILEGEMGSVNRRWFCAEVKKAKESVSFGLDYSVEGAFLPHDHPERKDYEDKPYEYFAGTSAIACGEMIIVAVVPEDWINSEATPQYSSAVLTPNPNMTFRECFYKVILNWRRDQTVGLGHLAWGRVRPRGCELIEREFVVGDGPGDLPNSKLFLERLRPLWPASQQFSDDRTNWKLSVPEGYLGLMARFSSPKPFEYGCLWWRESRAIK